MRLWLKDSERRPDPAPVRTDDRKAILVGITLWLLAMIAFLLFLHPLIEAGHRWWLWSCVTGIGLGLVGLLYTHRRHT
jgi:hypothetical protein